MKPGEAIVVFAIGSLTIIVFIVFLVLIIIEYRRRQLRHIEEKISLKHRYENELLQVQLEVQEQSFKHISEEIHDNIAQMLSLAKLKLYRTADRTTDEQAQKGINAGTELVTNALNDLRSLSHLLNGGLVSRLPLRDSIEKELGYVKDARDVTVSFMVADNLPELDERRKLMAFRIIQEAIINSVKHGDAKTIGVSMNADNNKLYIAISDDGRGFDTLEAMKKGGLGLQNMNVRAKMLGTIEIQSQEGKGTTINLSIQLHENDH
jgi:signal transduction histidine kinase